MATESETKTSAREIHERLAEREATPASPHNRLRPRFTHNQKRRIFMTILAAWAIVAILIGLFLMSGMVG